MANRRPRVLIIDEDAAFCGVVSDHLRLSGFEAVCKHCGQEGIKAASGDGFDVTVLGRVLPGHDGLTLLKSLRACEPATPVVYLTENQDSRVAVMALKAGAADYVIKDSNCDFLLLLENAVTNAMFAAAIKRDKERAEADVRAGRDEFKALAEERALLLREADHRVANSLQLIASCLHFQADMSESQEAKAALNEANTRVLAVARVHRSLYASFDLRWISLPSYLAALTGDLKDVAAGRNGDESSIALHAGRIQAEPDAAVAVGIVAAELILNALRHGYPDGSGPVRVWLKANGPDVKLIVEDDGVGGIEGLPGRRGLGQRIMAGMAEKLDGSLRYERRDHGTRAVLTFPLGKHVRLLPGTGEDMAPAA